MSFGLFSMRFSRRGPGRKRLRRASAPFSRHRNRAGRAGIGLLLLAGQTLAGSLTLWDFTAPPAAERIVTSDAEIQPGGAAGQPLLRVSTGTEQRWPGVTLRAPAGHWDLSPFSQVAIRLRNAGANRVTVSCRVDNPGADGTHHCVTGSLQLAPGRAGTLRVPLRRNSPGKLDGRLFGLRGYPVVPGGPRTVVASNITQLLLFVNQPTAPHVFELQRVQAEGVHTPPTAWVTDADPYFPLIDPFGQYRHRDWPGKVHSLAELQQRRRNEAKELARLPGPDDWCEYGGWQRGPKLGATGFFHTYKQDGAWWLIDPHGHRFWSHGIDCVLLYDRTAVEEREDWFAGFAVLEQEFPEFFSRAHALKGHYAGRSPRCFSFGRANLRRKYGPQWQEASRALAPRRLRSWGLNTIGNWSDGALHRLRRTPYTDNVNSGRTRMIEGSEGYWGKFPDVYDASFAPALAHSMAAKRGTSANDPWCLGYFSDNELSWGNDVSLAVAALKSPPDQPAKQAFIHDLKARHGSIETLNAAWDTDHASWEALLQAREAPDPAKARGDLTAFYTRTAERYFRLVREAIKTVAPHQLYLGCRFAWVNDLAARAAAKYCDVVSYNRYRRGVADLHTVGSDKPFLIGEFHFGALDRGLFHTGLVPVANQRERATTYTAYVRGALANPQCVGVHWFQYQDEPTTGRVYDEENYQIGFVDIADTPYAETIAASRALGRALYKFRSGL